MADLRPLERRVVKLAESGLDRAEIGRRFNRSEAHISRIIDLTQLPGRSPLPKSAGLRPLERRVLHLRGEGHDHTEIGRRFKRSSEHMRRVEGMALYKMARILLDT